MYRSTNRNDGRIQPHSHQVYDRYQNHHHQAQVYDEDPVRQSCWGASNNQRDYHRRQSDHKLDRARMSDKKLVSTKTNVDEKVETRDDGATVKTITTTTVEEYSDGSSSTKTSIKTITEGAAISQLDPTTGKPTGKSYNPKQAQSSAPRDKVTTDREFLNSSLEAHNDYRKKHHVPPLKLSDDLCQVAQAWANKIAAEGKMEHSENGFGENVHWSSGNVTDGKSPVDHWYSEVKDYKFVGHLDYQRGTGHFTQVVWKDTKELGIAKATGKRGDTYVVANYNPSGNFIGKFAENVLKP